VPGAGARQRALLALELAVVLAACSGTRIPEVDPDGLAAGDHEVRIRHQGRMRSALVHVPAGAAGPRALVLAFHGGGGEAEAFQQYAGLDAVADREGFVVVYPFGSGMLPRRLLTWNSGSNCCGYAVQNQVDDVGFALGLIEHVSTLVSVDARRIYATGHSNGAMMSHRLAAEAADHIAAIVPVAGAMALEIFAPTRPMPVLQIHSLDDPRALYQGGLGPPFPLTTQQVMHRPVLEGLSLWASHNGCPASSPTQTEQRIGSGRDAGQTATRLSYGACRSGAPVEHWRLTGSGHGWPGRPDVGLREELIGEPTTLIDAAEEAWAFFRRFAR
jgi:polyhydroxybutyrate depolymerase